MLGLDQIHEWGEDVLRQELAALRRDCPEIETVYKNILMKFMAEYFRGFTHKENQSVYAPSLAKFVKTFYMCLAADEAVRQMEIFNMYSIDRKYVFMNAMRQTLIEILKEPISCMLRDMTPRSADGRTPRTPTSAVRGSTPKMSDQPTPNPHSVFNEYVGNALMAVRDTQEFQSRRSAYSQKRFHPSRPSDASRA